MERLGQIRPHPLSAHLIAEANHLLGQHLLMSILSLLAYLHSQLPHHHLLHPPPLLHNPRNRNLRSHLNSDKDRTVRENNSDRHSLLTNCLTEIKYQWSSRKSAGHAHSRLVVDSER